MDFLKAQLTRIQEQLNGLTATQKMLTACLVAIMVMTLMWWSRWAAEPEMEPVLNQSLSTNDVGMIDNLLESKGIHHTVSGDRILVPADQKIEILSELGFAQLLPKKFDNAFDDIVDKNLGPFDSPDKTQHMYLEAKERTLSLVVSNFPGVADALVVIDPTDVHRLGDEASIEPSAMVTITTMHGDKSRSRQLADAAADVVSGAQAGLMRSKINVIIDGNPFTVADRDQDAPAGDGSAVDLQLQNEQFYDNKIRNYLGFIQGLMVSVTVKLDMTAKVNNIHTVSSDPKQSVHQEQMTDEQSQENTAQPAGASEPGAVSNVGSSVDSSASASGSSNTSSETKSQYVNDHSTKDEVIREGPGGSTVVAASLRVPRSYFMNAFRIKNKNQDPDDASLDAFTQSELSTIQKEAMDCTGIADAKAVSVGFYMDAAPTVAATVPGQTIAPLSMLNVHGKEIGVGFLAAMSMLMMFMMVKKGTPPPVVMAPPSDEEPTALAAGEAVAGQVTEGNAMLDGMELDDDSVKAQQMLDQVQQLVTTNPDAAAGLVKRWLNRT